MGIQPHEIKVKEYNVREPQTIPEQIAYLTGWMIGTSLKFLVPIIVLSVTSPLWLPVVKQIILFIKG